MDLLSFFRRKAPADQADRRGDGRGDGGGAEPARARARRRLIGAVVLLGAGIVAFPLLFETEPRPIPTDLPIEVPSPGATAPPAMPPPAVTPAQAPQVADLPPAATPAAAPDPAPAEPQVTAVAPPAVADPPKPAVVAPPPSDDGARAKALLDGRSGDAAPAPAARYVVQVGAFAEARAVRDVRARIEKLGMPTYTQVIKVSAGERTRVRVGPFDQRDEANSTAARLKKAGLPAVVLTL